jgi:hypothetical protein
VIREPGAKISLLPSHPINRPRSNGGEARESVVQMEMMATRPSNCRRFNTRGSINSSFQYHALSCRVRKSRCRGSGCHQSSEEKLLRHHDMFDTLKDRPARRHLLPDGHLLIDSCQGFGKSLPTLIQSSQDFLLFRLKHISNILTAKAARRQFPFYIPPGRQGFTNRFRATTSRVAVSPIPEARAPHRVRCGDGGHGNGRGFTSSFVLRLSYFAFPTSICGKLLTC